MKIVVPEGLTGKALYGYLVKNKTEIIRMKCDSYKNAECVIMDSGVDGNAAMKKTPYLHEDGDGTIKRTLVMNTYNWLDGHDDVHADNVFAKSISERGKDAPHLHDHMFQLDAHVGDVIKWYELPIAWKEFGVKKKGETMSLLLDSEILEEYNAFVYKMYKKGKIQQHSVRMGYVKLQLAVNDEDWKDEYAVWTAVLPKLGNPERAEKQGYFFYVTEGRLVEGSAVLAGSNELTPTMGPKAEPGKTTPPYTPKSLKININDLIKSYKDSRN